MNKTKSFLSVLTSATLLSASASATLFIYEPFDYADTGPINNGAFFGDGNQSGALGLTGTWAQVANAYNADLSPVNEIDVRELGLTFTDGQGNELPVTGGLITRDNRVGQTAAFSGIDPSATAALTADNSTIWISVLFQDRGFSGPDSAIALNSQEMIGNDDQDLVAPGFGVGIGVNSTGGPARNIGTVVYDNAARFSSVRELTPTFDGPGASDVHLLAMKVNWNPAGTPDEIFVFDITDISTEPDEADALAFATFDFDLAAQQSLTILNIGETQVDNWDEVRVGTSFEAVMGGVAPPASLDLDIALSGPGSYEFSWNSQDGQAYDLVSSTDLSTPPTEWEVYEGNSGIVGTAPQNTLVISEQTDVKRFFAIVAKGPVPPPLLAEDFESVTALTLPVDWSGTDNGAGTVWQVGSPNSAVTGPETAANGLQCAGTNIGADYTASAEASLITKAFTVPAGGATLTFSQYIDSEVAPSGDLGSIRLLNGDDDSVLAGGDLATALEGRLQQWTIQEIPLPAAAGGLSVKIEFSFASDDGVEVASGFYIDDVLVTGN
jgi:hypothetical protein